MTAVDPTDPNHVFFLRDRDIAISVDGGDTINAVVTLPGGAHPTTISVPFGGGRTIAFGTVGAGVFLSPDGGGAWTRMGSLTPRWVLNIAWTPYPGGVGTWIIATSNGVYRMTSTDTEWGLVAGAGYVASDIEIGPRCSRRIYASFGAAIGPPFVEHRGGVIISTDGGGRWSSLTAGLDIHQAPITHLQVDPAFSRFVYASVFGRGLWMYDARVTPGCP